MFLTLIYYKNIFFVFSHQPANVLKEERLLISICLLILQETCTPKFHTRRKKYYTTLTDIRGVEPLIVVDLCYFYQILILYPITRNQPRNGLFGIPFIVWLPHQSTTGYSSVSFQKVYCYHDQVCTLYTFIVDHRLSFLTQ